MTNSSRIQNVAIVGAGGNLGTYITSALLTAGHFKVTALTRADSKTSLPNGLHVIKPIDYSDPSTIVSALQGQDALIIILNGYVPNEIQDALVDAAIEAGVKYILPNEWSPDSTNEGMIRDVSVFAVKTPARARIAEKGNGKTCYISVMTGFWYEWSLAITPAYGFDFEKKTVTFFDDGKTVTNMSTWPQCGRAVAALLSLPIEAESGAKTSLSAFKNGVVFVSSFGISQKDMFESALRVTGTKEDDWQISYEPAEERFTNAVEKMKTGDQKSFVTMLYTRIFYKDDCGHFEKTKGLQNGVLGLPVEDLDEATAAAIKRSKEVKMFQ
ncbi:hypothetical protein B0A48_00932 [Cryoendolithus antarcticus]|uniref:NmrA-like domain-containing protein n=1 Tax=Cryoendolithus antarcticus TaxID=1507870 RepID=A0A1V8TRS3_9PEZI|nr:hypothetical protein B0A48_00932 [Cryoendolithus antarcticus]